MMMVIAKVVVKSKQVLKYFESKKKIDFPNGFDTEHE